jgi:hypothetical protein
MGRDLIAARKSAGLLSKTGKWLIAVFFAVVCQTNFSGRAFSSEIETTEAAQTNQVQKVLVDVRTNVQGSLAAIRYAFITVGSVKHSFIVPEGYRVDSTHPRQIKLIRENLEAFITVAFEDAVYPNTPELLREHISRHFAGAEIISENALCMAGVCSPAVDFRWKASGAIRRVSREVFFPTASGVVRMALTSSPQRFNSTVADYNLVLQTFRTSTNGKFDFCAILANP